MFLRLLLSFLALLWLRRDKAKRTSVRVRHVSNRLYDPLTRCEHGTRNVGKENEKVSEPVMKIIWDENLCSLMIEQKENLKIKEGPDLLSRLFLFLMILDLDG